jgi:SAM-dependent methyltransferase
MRINDDRNRIDREAGVQGPRWHTVHEGYFADAAIAQPFVEAVRRAVLASKPDVVADLGGGTGFVLCQLRAAGLGGAIHLVNVDLSATQLAECDDRHIECLPVSAARVSRRDLNVGNGRLMIIMRSLLHYFGGEGLRPLLRHLAAQLAAGEMLVHQTASFAERRDADCLNLLYQKMGTDKWYPTLGELRKELEAVGLAVCETESAPPLALTSADLAERYHLSGDDVQTVAEELSQRFGPVPAVFSPAADGFTAWLHYHILTCRRTS